MKKLKSIHVYDNAKSLRALRDVFYHLTENFGGCWKVSILRWSGDKEDETHQDNTLEIVFSCSSYPLELNMQDVNFWLKGYFAHVEYPYDAPGT